jgi:hypothetical protein
MKAEREFAILHSEGASFESGRKASDALRRARVPHAVAIFDMRLFPLDRLSVLLRSRGAFTAFIGRPVSFSREEEKNE